MVGRVGAGNFRVRLAIAALALVGTACNPLLDDSSSLSNCLLGITADSGSGQSLSGRQAAEAFVVAGADATVTSISIKLNVTATDNLTLPSGNIYLAIEPDATAPTGGFPQPTVPSGGTVSGLSHDAAIDASTLVLNVSAFYSADTIVPITLHAGQAYWVGAQGPAANGIDTITWEQSAGQVYVNGFAWANGAVLSPKTNLLALINCGVGS